MTTATTERHARNYTSLDDILADAERLVQANASTTGNWSLGQILEHLAIVMDCSIDGYGAQASWPMRLIGRLFLKSRFLKKTLPAGFRFPKKFEHLAPAEVSPEAGLEHLRKSIDRLKTESQRSPNPILGNLTQEEYNLLHMRHAELHMSFIAEPQ